MDCYSLYVNNISPSYNYCDNSKNMQHLERKMKKKNGKISTGVRKEVKLSTDPQSVAARERRQRVSERFKILKSLVPGTENLDTVSMLEEDIVHIKFLKDQLWWLIHYHNHQSQNINLNNNNNHHFIIDGQPLTFFNDLPCDGRDPRQISIPHDCGLYLQNASDYNHEMAQVHGFQDSRFQIEGAQQAMHFDNVGLESRQQMSLYKL